MTLYGMVNLQELIQSVGNGGLKLMDIETKVKSLKAVWVKRFLDLSSHRWNVAPSFCFYQTMDIHFVLVLISLP